jgi:hypothetical protein
VPENACTTHYSYSFSNVHHAKKTNIKEKLNPNAVIDILAVLLSRFQSIFYKTQLSVMIYQFEKLFRQGKFCYCCRNNICDLGKNIL